jgi:hypothetical protein
MMIGVKAEILTGRFWDTGHRRFRMTELSVTDHKSMMKPEI